ncbi:MAG: Phosphoenolpyruvate carboxykinase [ATP] [uncultured Gemmatimonadetes bacterium]|uniref:Phosphoenolpyruvate carboxykinase (ATP) n=1 Tax=uncultured Gemmatimonadota bacterium TaxID=203437 RepID=A0A6J4K2D1_9BACT|nr:MAG: Phosphoenolpyruvate carboxykinase [ATP] [uncultured Gemmatimonadota bacterium]
MATTLNPSTDAPAFGRESRHGLDNHGLRNPGTVFWNLTPAELVEHAVQRREGILVEGGPFNAVTRPHTGRSPNDKFVVRDENTEADVWWGKVNQPISPEHYAALREDVLTHLEGQNLYVRDMWAGADPEYRLAVRVITPNAWHNLFANNMFRRPDDAELEAMVPGFTILHAPEYEADPARHGTRTSTFILVNFTAKEIMIGGTRYAGELKKSIFSILNYLLPRQGVLAMHCSANIGPDGDTALFFGLSGTGKTTLSADPERGLIGDDEHGWTDRGIFNFEGGCYAKAVKLSPEGEPEIYATTRMFGTVLENCIVDEKRRVDFDDISITENTRISYPLHYITNFVPDAQGGHPRNIVFLTADAYGVLPPISRLTPEQAMFYFLSGYTAKVAGTERGVKEPQPTFSACFGQVFLPLHPGVYADLLGQRIAEHGSRVWLVNTGWTGGPYGVGSRMKLSYTRAMVRAALAGELDDVETVESPFFRLHIPTSIPGVPSEVLVPRETWADKDAFDKQARELADKFIQNFEQFADRVPEAVRTAGPRPA